MARTKKGGRRTRGPGRKGVSQVPLYLESPEAEYIPTYLVRVPSHSLTSTVSPSFSCPRVRSPPSSHFPPSSPPRRSGLGPARVIPLKVYAMIHAIEQQRGPTSDLLHLVDDARRDVAVVLSFSLFFYSFLFPPFLLCRPVARARNPAERVYSFCWFRVH